jgi:hypothetical protein
MHLPSLPVSLQVIGLRRKLDKERTSSVSTGQLLSALGLAS